MFIVRLFSFTAATVFLFAQPALASVVINEVLFNPSGASDTGLEKIEFYNNGDAFADMSGWDLYPDGIGYFTIPAGFSLPAKAFVAVHLRISGTKDAANLYTGSSFGSGNMSDTSGSIALFNANVHKKETLVDFVEWSSKGASSTWESYAAESGLWTKGVPVDTASLVAGNSVGLIDDGVRQNAASWKIYSALTIGSPNMSPAGASGGEQAPASPPADSSGKDEIAASGGSTSRPPPPSIKAYAGEDRIVFQGAAVEFRGRADGINGDPLSTGRFFWNFGDGTTREGKMTLHTYYFPGTYNVSLNVSSGEYAGADYLKVTVVSPNFFISEAKPGERGFIELYNNTAYRLDLGGFVLKDGSKAFAIERDTYISPKSALVFSNIVTGLLMASRPLALNDAYGFAIDSADFSSSLLLEESFERVSIGDNKFVKTKSPTPGAYSSVLAGKAPTPVEEKHQENTGARVASVTSQASPPEEIKGSTTTAAEGSVVDENKETAAMAAGVSPSIWLLAASVVIGLIAAGGFLLFRL